MKRKLTAEKERQTERRVEAQEHALRRGRAFRDAHHYEALVIEPTIQSSPGDDTPLIQVWFLAKLKDDECVDRYLREIDQLIKDAECPKGKGA